MQIIEYLYRKKRNLIKFSNQRITDFKIKFPYLKVKLLHPKTAFLVYTPDYWNVGDIAIWYAEKKLFEENNINFYEVTCNEIASLSKKGFLNVFNGSKIYVTGGGFLGNLWLESNILINELIMDNTKSKIIILPSTLYFDKSTNGQTAYKNSIELYNSHKNLTVCCREITSYNLIKSVFKNVELIPDMVLSLSAMFLSTERKGLLLCTRNDTEKTLSEDSIATIYNITNSYFDTIEISDNVENKPFELSEREQILFDRLSVFASKELVITDRLHGMIFSLITNTPCIVLNSKSTKLKGVYEWITEFDYIKFGDDINNIPTLIDELKCVSPAYSNTKYIHYFNKLIKLIK